MRVGITTFGGDGGTSGISRYIIKLLEQLALLPDGPELEIVVYDDEKSIFVPSGDRATALSFGRRWHNPVLNVAWHQVALPRLCSKRGFDVLFLPAGNRRLPFWSPCPSVGTVHDLSSVHVAEKYDPARTVFITKVLPVLIRKLNVVLTVSESSKRDIVQHCGIPEDRVVVTPNGVDHDEYYPRDKEESLNRVQSRYHIRRPYLLYVSRIEHPGKNHARLIQAFGRMKSRVGVPHQLVLAGGDWDRSEEVHQLADQSPHRKDILFTGFVDHEDLPYLYCGADIFVFPSLYEGFGIPILEAMACGTPVACSNVSSMPEVAGDAAPMFDPNEEEEIADTMEQLLSNAARREEYVQRGLARSQEYTWSNTATKTVEAFHRAWRGCQ